MKIVKMMVEYLECPLGIDNHNFQFVWILDGAYDEKQNAYSIVLEKDDDIVFGEPVLFSLMILIVSMTGNNLKAIAGTSGR